MFPRKLTRYHPVVTMLLLFALGADCLANNWIIERRKDQNPTQPAYLVVPLPYSKPGIGEGVTLLGTLTNVGETTADITGLLVGGDAEGAIVNGSDVPLYTDILFLNFYLQNIDKAAVNNYSIRGINNTDKDDFTLLELSLARELNFELNLSFFERRLNLYYSYNDGKFQVDRIKDNNGNLITELSEPYIVRETRDHFRFSLDFTDDYLDPRTGLRFDITYADHDADNKNDADYYTLDYNLLGYLPIGKVHTMVLNFYQSDAHVRRQGNTDPASIRAELNANCDPSDTECLDTEQEIVNNFINARSNGTASSLGGDLRLRSFPQSRYEGAHMAFVGAEFRWNIVQEATPFDYFIWKDVRTGYQIALFTEFGTVSETSSQLWDEVRNSTGIGFRLLAASGAVYRADIATGKEGYELIVIFEYPWE